MNTMPERGRLFVCFILSVALWLNMFAVNDATTTSTTSTTTSTTTETGVHRHKHHSINSYHRHHQQNHHSTEHHHQHHHHHHHVSNNNNNGHNSVSGHHMQNTQSIRHDSLLHPTTATVQNNRSVNTDSSSNSNGKSHRDYSRNMTTTDADASISTQRMSQPLTTTTIKSQKLSLINAHTPFNRIGNGDLFHAKRWLDTDTTARRIDTFNWRINFNPISTTTTASPNGIVHRRVLFNDQRIFTKSHTQRGRHVCVEHKTALMPITERKEITLPCRDEKNCKNSKLYFDNTIASAQPTAPSIVYMCCPGWTKIHPNSPGCNRPICKSLCKNGGKCVKPEHCHCPKGFTGAHCEQDINECVTDKPCDQQCFNTHGSFYCTCRTDFILQADQQSCKKNVRLYNDGSAFEARDLENDVDRDSDDLTVKINNLEKIVIGEKHRNVESNKLMHNTMESVKSMRLRLDGMENRQNEVNVLRDKLITFEAKAQKLEYTVDVLYKCRFNPTNYYCP